MQNNLYCAIKSCATVKKIFLYMEENVPRRSGKCCATVRGMFLCGEDFVDEAGGVMHNRFFLIPHVNILQL